MDTVGVLTYDVESGDRRWAALPGDISTSVVFLDPTTARRRPTGEQSGCSSGSSTASVCGPKRAAPPAATSPAPSGTRLGPADEPYRRTCAQFDEPPADPTLSVEQPPTTIQIPTG